MADFKTITLGDGSLAKVDPSDFDYLNQWKWQNLSGYAGRHVYPVGMKGDAYTVLMHRQVLGCPEKLCVDHINHETLDNTKKNLRIATKSQNQWNKVMAKNNKSGVKGVSWDKATKKWRAAINMKEKYINLGRFNTLEEASIARSKAIKKLHGEFARIG